MYLLYFYFIVFLLIDRFDTPKRLGTDFTVLLLTKTNECEFICPQLVPYVLTTYGPHFVGKHRDAFQRSSLCDLPLHELATMRPRRGIIRNSLTCRDCERIQFPVPRHIAGSTGFHWVLSQKIIRRLRYVAIRFTTQAPRNDPANCPHPRLHWLGVKLDTAGTPPTHNNLPAAETCKTRPHCNLWRLAPPTPPPSFERKPALLTGAMAHVIATWRRLPWQRRIRSIRQDPCVWSPHGVKLSSADYNHWYLPLRVPCPKPERTGFKGRGEIKKTIDMMIIRGIHGYYIQETWLLGNISRTTRGHLLLHHGMKKNHTTGVVQAAELPSS